MAKNRDVLSLNNDAAYLRIKSIVDLIVCEVCSIAIALIIDTLIFSGYFNASSTPAIFVCILLVLIILALAFRFWKFGIGARAGRTMTSTLSVRSLVVLAVMVASPAFRAVSTA